MPNSIVKLMIYQHEANTTFVHGFKATDWSDFLIVEAPIQDQAQFEQLSQIFEEYSQKMAKQIILVPRGFDIDFYGVKVDDGHDDQGQEDS